MEIRKNALFSIFIGQVFTLRLFRIEQQPKFRRWSHSLNLACNQITNYCSSIFFPAEIGLPQSKLDSTT